MEIVSSDVSLLSKIKNVHFFYQQVDISFITKDTRKNDSFVDLKTDYIALDMDIQTEEIDEYSLKNLIIRLIIEKITGKKIKTISLKDINENIDLPEQNTPEFAGQVSIRQISYDKEEVAFKAYGVIKAKDGKEIKFDVTFFLSKEALSYTELDVKSGSLTLIDPLIINFDGNLQDILSDTNFIFDIDSDGKEERIPYLTKGNGFLVFDKNQNGKVDDGRELFGTETGDGFFELKQLDHDKNGWIDEKDPVFYELGVWIKSKNKDVILSLKDVGIEAVYIANTYTRFNYGSGVLKSSGIYVKDSLDVGIISQVDFLV